MENTLIHSQAQVLADELRGLHGKLKHETDNARKLRDAYDSECRRVPTDDVKLVATKLLFDAAEARVETIKTEITPKECMLDEAQGREADERRREQLGNAYENSTKRLSEAKAELDKLRAEYSAMPNKIRVAKWHFQEALRAFNEAKSNVASL